MAVLAGQLTRRTGRSVSSLVTAVGWERRIGIVGIAAIVLLAIFAPLVTHFDPTAIDPVSALQSPSLAHPFGTDMYGRDVLARVLFGARIDLQIGIIGVAIPLVCGTAIGLVAGFYGGWIDSVIGRVIDVVVAFPFLILVIAIVAMLGPGLLNFYIAVSLVSWVAYARIIRAEVLSARGREYVLAARMLGYSDTRIMFRHLLPNVVPAVFVFAMSDVVLDILTGASLGFFGLGVQPPTPEWGVMIADGRDFITTAWWMVAFPGLAIIVTGFFFSLLGDGLADFVRRFDAE
jgi:peptide/nickel transport system permease protein